MKFFSKDLNNCKWSKDPVKRYRQLGHYLYNIKKTYFSIIHKKRGPFYIILGSIINSVGEFTPMLFLFNKKDM